MASAFTSRAWVLGVTAGLGVSLSGLAALFVHRWEMTQQQTRFQQEIENLGIALQRSLNRYTDVLTFLNDYYAVNRQVSPQEFDTFVARSLAEYPGIQALEWAPRVTLADRTTYEARLQGMGYANFEITELGSDNRLQPAGTRPDYLPVTYIAPLVGNEAAVGFDLLSNPARVAAIASAQTTGVIHATGRIRLVQEQRDQYGFLVVLPLYQGTELPPPTDRQAQFEGILLGVFRVSDVVEEALQGLGAAVDFDLRDQNAEPEEQFLGRYDAAAETVIAASSDRSEAQHRRTRALCPSSCTRTLEIGQRQWSVAFYPSDDYGLVLPYAHWGSLLTGLLLTGSLVLFLRNLQQDLEQTQALNELKLRFFSMASHELRTPLSTILLSAESLQLNFEAMSAAQKHKSLQRIHQTAQQMSQQVTDWLTLTRAEVGKLEFSPVLVEAIALCQQVIDEVQGGVSQTIVFEVDTQTLKAFWDPKLLRSLLSNLLSNGAKYSPPDSLIQVRLRSMATQAEIQVCDCGRGIPTADQAQIQDAFQRGSNVEEIAGTGLGLAIVQVCVELHRGQWQLLSKEGKGTTVVVTLPLE